MSGRLVSLALLVGGVAVIVGASALGTGSDALERLVTPPPLARAALVAVMVVLGVGLARASIERFTTAGASPGHLSTADPIVMLRGIGLAFLALAAFAAAGGWLLATPLPLVVAGIIAAVDVVETSFLLLVVGPLRARGPDAGPPAE